MMIVIPMILFALTMPLIFGGEAIGVYGAFQIRTLVDVLGGDPRVVLRFCGLLMFCAAASVFWVRARNADGLPVGAMRA